MNNLAYIALNSNKDSYTLVSVSIPAKGFFIGFLPCGVAHLAKRKEQSSKLKITDREGCYWGRHGGRITFIYGSRSTLFVTEVEIRDSRLSNLLKGSTRKAERGGLVKDHHLKLMASPLIYLMIYTTSIQQFLTVLAMSILTTSDLEITSIRIVRRYA